MEWNRIETKWNEMAQRLQLGAQPDRSKLLANRKVTGSDAGLVTSYPDQVRVTGKATSNTQS